MTAPSGGPRLSFRIKGAGVSGDTAAALGVPRRAERGRIGFCSFRTGVGGGAGRVRLRHLRARHGKASINRFRRCRPESPNQG